MSIIDASFVLAVSLVIAGVAMLSVPAALIVAGLVTAIGSVGLSRGTS